jgi:hypothetical protein
MLNQMIKNFLLYLVTFKAINMIVVRNWNLGIFNDQISYLIEIINCLLFLYGKFNDLTNVYPMLY